jgi:hypothetical protein
MRTEEAAFVHSLTFSGFLSFFSLVEKKEEKQAKRERNERKCSLFLRC